MRYLQRSVYSLISASGKVGFTLVKFSDDGFSVTAAEPWIRGKVSIIQQYLSSFAGTLAGKVDDVVFIDLFAGNGIYSLGTRKDLFAASSLMAPSLDLPITKFILCEKDESQLRTLKIRVNKYFKEKNILLMQGKPEELISKFPMYVPPNNGTFKTAVFCLADPFSFDLPFDTVDRLSDLGFTFLIPFSFALNDRLNYRFYLHEQRDKLKKFLGGYNDISRLEKDCDSNHQFYKRLVQLYENSMLSLGYNISLSTHKVDSGLMELPSYQIGFFSKQLSTKAIHQDVEATRHVQFDLFQ